MAPARRGDDRARSADRGWVDLRKQQLSIKQACL
jgi:hypothetical protein